MEIFNKLNDYAKKFKTNELAINNKNIVIGNVNEFINKNIGHNKNYDKNYKNYDKNYDKNDKNYDKDYDKDYNYDKNFVGVGGSITNYKNKYLKYFKKNKSII